MPRFAGGRKSHAQAETQAATLARSLSPEGRGRGEGARACEKSLRLPNPLTLAHFVRIADPSDRCSLHQERRPKDAYALPSGER
jgi:hypothetical protein